MLRELHIVSYKNLEAVRLTLGPRTVIYGRNGAGKTNRTELAS